MKMSRVKKVGTCRNHKTQNTNTNFWAYNQKDNLIVCFFTQTHKFVQGTPLINLKNSNTNTNFDILSSNYIHNNHINFLFNSMAILVLFVQCCLLQLFFPQATNGWASNPWHIWEIIWAIAQAIPLHCCCTCQTLFISWSASCSASSAYYHTFISSTKIHSSVKCCWQEQQQCWQWHSPARLFLGRRSQCCNSRHPSWVVEASETGLWKCHWTHGQRLLTCVFHSGSASTGCGRASTGCGHGGSHGNTSASAGSNKYGSGPRFSQNEVTNLLEMIEAHLSIG